MDLDSYLAHVSEFATTMASETESFASVLERRYASETLIGECLAFRRDLVTEKDKERIGELALLGFFQEMDASLRFAAWAMTFDIIDAGKRSDAERLCVAYDKSQPLFVGSPTLWSSIRRRSSGKGKLELIDVNALGEIDGSEVVGVEGGWAKIPFELPPSLVRALAAAFPASPLFVRLLPDFFSRKKPAVLLREAVITPGRLQELMAFNLSAGQIEHGEYVLQDNLINTGSPQAVLDFRVREVRRLELVAKRRDHNLVTMMIEELSRPDGESGIMTGYCVHLDTTAPNGMRLRDVRLSHLDLAINVYKDATRAKREGCRLKEGRVTDADLRTHLCGSKTSRFLRYFRYVRYSYDPGRCFGNGSMTFASLVEALLSLEVPQKRIWTAALPLQAI